MSYQALVDFFCEEDHLPVHVDQVLKWIRENTDHNNIALHGVDRDKKGFKGGFRRKAINTGSPYSQNPDDLVIYTDIFYGLDLSEEWKRLVIVKEAIHVFDAPGVRVDTPEGLAQLIPRIITGQLTGSAPFAPALNDHFGAFRAMAVLLPLPLRDRMKAAIDDGSRTVEEVASFCQLPEVYV
ncbi:hypothetical protein IQ272_32655, partial [Chroococcidiopsidales cyanobacterium LEGE 13417]|nr:hypothetical protein [Chroococcidiopsidales cyanobacterium LEGE 13417]